MTTPQPLTPEEIEDDSGYIREALINVPSSEGVSWKRLKGTTFTDKQAQFYEMAVWDIPRIASMYFRLLATINQKDEQLKIAVEALREIVSNKCDCGCADFAADALAKIDPALTPPNASTT